MEVKVPVGYPRKFDIELLSKYSQVEVKIVEDQSVFVPTNKEQKIYGMSSLINKVLDSKLPATGSAFQFLDIADSIDQKKMNVVNIMGQLTNYLKQRSYLVDGKLTIADVSLYLVLYDSIFKKIQTPEEKKKPTFIDLYRWADLIFHSLGDTRPEFELVKAPYNQNKQGDGKGQKKAAKEKKPKESKREEPEALQHDPCSYLDIRVGKIVKIEPHPNADALYCEDIDIGGGVIKKVITGVRKYYTLEQMLNRHVIVFCNIMPSKIRGSPSEGMLFAASNEDHTIVELLDPPANTPIGTRVMFGDLTQTDPVPVDKKGALWKACDAHCKIDAEGRATFKGQLLRVPEGNLTVPTLKNVSFH